MSCHSTSQHPLQEPNYALLGHMDNPDSRGVERIPPESQPTQLGPFDREAHYFTEPLLRTRAMFSIYDLVLILNILTLLVLSAVTIPVIPPHSPGGKERIYPWLFYGARIAIFVSV